MFRCRLLCDLDADRITNEVHAVVNDCIVKKVLKDGTADIGEEYAGQKSEKTDKMSICAIAKGVNNTWQ